MDASNSSRVGPENRQKKGTEKGRLCFLCVENKRCHFIWTCCTGR